MREIAIAVLALVALSCGHATVNLIDYYRSESQEERLNRMRSAPIIVVGKVKGVEMRGEPKPAARLSDLSLQLYTAVIKVEMVVRGSAEATLEFSFFGPDPRNGLLGLPKFYLRPDERRLFFLKLENRRYRAVGDYLDYSEPVYSGTPDSSQVRDANPDRAIARILLTPSHSLQDAAMFSSTLFDAAGRARSFASHTFVQELLEHLVTHPDMEVREQACRNLKIHHKRSAVCTTE